MAKNEINSASLLSGIAIGAVVTMLAAIAIVPDGNDNGGGRNLTTIGAGDPGSETIDDLDFGALEASLEEGEELAIDESTGEVFAVDASGATRSLSSGAGGEFAAGAPASGGSGGDAAGGGSGDGGSTDGGGSGSGVQIGGGGTGTGGASGDGSGGGGGGAGCAAGANGGSTDVGVTGSEIKLGATVAESGIAQNFLGQVRQGMEAIKNKTNRAGGVCGRQLKIVYKDDGWEAQRGSTFIKNLVEGEKVFAMAVSPSSEGLNQASQQGYFQQQGVPVVGADGLNATQFKDPMIWPVAAATTTTVDVMMKDAWDRGVRNPAIVFGNTYRFGVEGAFAFNQAYKKLSGGKDIPGYKNPLSGGGGACEGRFCGVSAGTGQYSNQVSAIGTACSQGDKCDFMLLLLEPKSAQDWMATPGVGTASTYQPGGLAGPQPLFTFDFGRNCGDKCNGMRVWTGYNPPIEQYRTSQAVSTYVSDLKSQSASADEFNQFTMGGYVGMQLLVEALKQTGPDLTRKGLAETLNSMGPLNTGLTTTALKWTASARYANHSAQAFEIQSKNGFTGWRFVKSPMRDPWLGQHAG